MAERHDYDRERTTDRERGEWDRGREGDWGRNREPDWGRGREGDWNRERRFDFGREGEGRWGREDWNREGWRGGEGRGREDWGRERYGGTGDWNRENWGGRQGGFDEGRYSGRSEWDRGRETWGRERHTSPRDYPVWGTGREDLYGTGTRGFGTGNQPGMSYFGWGAGGYSGGMGTYGERGRYYGKGPKGYQRSDDRIREDVCEYLTRHPDVDASDIEVQVRNGEVTLTGSVESREAKRQAEDAAENVSGVREVHNQIRVQHHAMAGQHTGGQGGQQHNK